MQRLSPPRPRLLPRLIASALILTGWLIAAWPSATLAEAITTIVPHALVMDEASRTILFEKAADDPVAPAALVKLMTAELVFRELRKGAITLDTPFNISETAWRAGSRGTSMFARLNSSVRVEDLLRGLIVQSGNDAAIALAEGVAGSEATFADMMNQRAAELGLTRSHFTDSWGGDGQSVTARDMATLAVHLQSTYPDYVHFFGEKEFTWNKIRQLNRNPILFMDIGADGMKVGNLAEGGYNLVGAASQGGQRMIVVLLDAKVAKDRAEEARKLFNWAFHGFDARMIFLAGETIGVARVFGGAESGVALTSDTPIRLLTPRGTSDRLTGKIVYNGPLIAPVEAGAQVARLKIWRGAMLVLDAPLKTAVAVEQGPLTQRAKDAAFELGVQLFRSSLSHGMRLIEKKTAASTAP